MKAWWFSAGYTLPHGDGRRIKVGATHKVEGEIVPCLNGLHASVQALDALDYAPGTIVWRVQMGGTIVRRDDKVAASERTYLAGGVDVSDTLRKFARMCALDVIHLWGAPDVVVRYLKTGDESINPRQTIVPGAWAVASRDAAWEVARDAAWQAALTAAGDAAGAAAGDAGVWDAAWKAAWDAARDAQNRRLSRMLTRAIR